MDPLESATILPRKKFIELLTLQITRFDIDIFDIYDLLQHLKHNYVFENCEFAEIFQSVNNTCLATTLNSYSVAEIVKIYMYLFEYICRLQQSEYDKVIDILYNNIHWLFVYDTGVYQCYKQILPDKCRCLRGLFFECMTNAVSVYELVKKCEQVGIGIDSIVTCAFKDISYYKKLNLPVAIGLPSIVHFIVRDIVDIRRQLDSSPGLWLHNNIPTQAYDEIIPLVVTGQLCITSWYQYCVDNDIKIKGKLRKYILTIS